MNRHQRHIQQGLLLLLSLLALYGGLAARPAAHAASTDASQNQAFLPLVVGPSQDPAPNPPTGNLPAELAGTWFSGQMLSLQMYNRDTNTWSDPGGLGHMYVFGADGSYTLASYLKLGEGTMCVSTVWKYQQGAARVEGASLLLTPSLARTRTVVSCGGNSESELDGPYTTITIPWQLVQDDRGHTTLQLSEAQGATTYYKHGLATQMLGTWRSGGVHAADFYNPVTGDWLLQEGAGEWYQFNADGTFRRGEVVLPFSDGECQQVVMTYQEGSLSGSGANITLQVTAGRRISANLCDLSQAVEEVLPAGSADTWTWSLLQREEGQTLELLRISTFRQLFLVRE
jgi:hypothetical protein